MESFWQSPAKHNWVVSQLRIPVPVFHLFVFNEAALSSHSVGVRKVFKLAGAAPPAQI